MTDRFQGVFIEYFCIVRNVGLLLSRCASTIDTTFRLLNMGSRAVSSNYLVAFVELPPINLRILSVTHHLEECETHGCLSSSRTFAPRSRRVCAAERPARPPPTTMTCAEDIVKEKEIRNGRAPNGEGRLAICTSEPG